MTVGVNSGKLNSRIYEGCLNYGFMCKIKSNICIFYQGNINWYLVQAASLSTEYQVLSVEQQYGTGPQDQRIMAKEPHGNIPSIICIHHEKVSSRAKITLSCLHLK